MSDYTSSPSRPASPIGPLPDPPTARPSTYRFNWDPASRRPGPASVSETTEGRGDHFTTTPKVDIYGATSSSANFQPNALPSQWSSTTQGFHAISTVVNNPHKKSAPPKAHASVPPAPRVELPRVRRKDFDPYLATVGSEWETLQHNLVLGRAALSQLEGSDLDSPHDTLRTPRLPKSLPPLSSIPQIFFTTDFDLGDPRTFNAVAEVSSSSTPSSSYLSTASGSTSPETPRDPSTLAHSLPLLEKLSHHADTLEQHLIHEIARRATPFFAALSNLQDLQAESARCLERVQALRSELTSVGENGARRGLHGVQREIRLAHLREVQAGVRAIRGVVETVGVVRGLVDGREWGAALDGVDELHAMWDGAPTMPPSLPSQQGTTLPSVAEEEPPGDGQEVALREEGRAAAAEPVMDIPLSRLKAFAALPSQLQTLTQEITSSLTSDLVDVLKIGLSERIHHGHSSSDEHTEMIDRLRPLIQGLVRTRNLRESVAVWRDVVLEEVHGVMQQHVPSFDPADDPQKESTNASSLRSMTHAEFQIVLRLILKSFLNCVEGLRALNGNITQVVEDIRPPALPSELTAIQDSLFDTLSSSAESANVLISKVITARAEQQVKLDLREFLETFNECWNFVVRCEIICRRMIVGLRGAVVSQAKTFLQAFHQARISQSAKLVEDEQWSQADVPGSLQQVVNLILDAAVHDPRELILKIETIVAAPSVPLLALSPIRPPSSPLLSPSKDSRPSSPRPSSPRPSSPRTSTRANGTPHVRKHLRIEERSYFTVPATQEMLLLLIDYLRVIVNLSLLTTDTMSRVIEFLKAYNSRTCQVVLGAGAMRSAGLKNITAKHLALASQSLSVVIALIPYVRETFRRHLSPKQAVMLVEFDKLKRDYQEHQNEIHAKLVAIMGDRLSAHIKSLNAIRWDAPPPKPGTNEYMELLVKETVTLHKVLSRYLASAVVEFVMTQVFAAINHRLSEEYSKIELPTLDAKERLLTDARYLHEKFSVLKTAGAPTALLETLVADKRVTSAPLSPRPTTPTPPTPLPLPPNNVPLGAAARPGANLTKRPSLFSNERIKGMLSRGNTAPPPSAPVPTQEKQGGFKQVVVPLSPTPREPVAETPNGDVEEDEDGRAETLVNVDAAPQGDREVAEHLEHPPPTPAKDEAAAAGRTPAAVPVA
ncbi:Vps54-like protein-domain-containing protein [Lactarius quietus]|nr:Vps54-like protein-domain-containing protein [Lactarius quietus]